LGDNYEILNTVWSFDTYPYCNDWRSNIYAIFHCRASHGLRLGQCGGPVVTRHSTVNLFNEGELLMTKATTIVLVLTLLPMLGCSPLENQARDTAAALSGSIVAAQTKYQASCAANPTQEICQVINRGVSGENALLTAVETYCGWTPTLAPPEPTATCVPVKSAQAALQAAIANAGTLTLQIKGAI
jgi:hypothetical protein